MGISKSLKPSLILYSYLLAWFLIRLLKDDSLLLHKCAEKIQMINQFMKLSLVEGYIEALISGLTMN